MRHKPVPGGWKVKSDITRAMAATGNRSPERYIPLISSANGKYKIMSATGSATKGCKKVEQNKDTAAQAAQPRNNTSIYAPRPAVGKEACRASHHVASATARQNAAAMSSAPKSSPARYCQR